MDGHDKTLSQRFNYGGGEFEVSQNGVYFQGKDKDGNETAPQWICSELRVTALTRDAKNDEWGRLIEWHDADGHAHQWAMPMELLEGDGSEVRRFLASRGVNIAPSGQARNLLAAYLKVCPVSDRVRCVETLGWHGGTYVTADGSIGAAEERIVFQNRHAQDPATALQDSARQWRDTVARMARDNSRLVFAISCAFAGPLVEMAGEDSGGFHLRGGSSSGKSTALKVAASAWGQPEHYVRSWRSTTNGLEGLAVLHNDGTMILDEIGQADPYAVGDAAYLLANGRGKARAGRDGLAKAAHHWRTLFLSAGEESLSALMEQAGKKVTAGQEIRLAEIEADAGAGMGVFENLHGHESGAALAVALGEAAKSVYGTVGQVWLERLVANRPALLGTLTERLSQFVSELIPNGAHGQVVRVAQRFALVALAGELATEYGLTGWPAGEAKKAAIACFNSWLAEFGDKGDRESLMIVRHAQSFLEKHGNSRFEYLKAREEERVSNRVGFFRAHGHGQREFLISANSFREHICQAYPVKTVVAALAKAGMLVKASNGAATQVVRL